MLIVRRVPRGGASVSAALTTLESITALTIAHSAAGGELPEAGWLLPAAAIAYGASALVLSRRATIRMVLPALVATQVLLHAWLVTLSAGDHAAHLGPAELLGLTGPMLAAHLAAGTVTAVAWLVRRRAVDVLVAWSDDGRLPLPRHRRTAPAATPHPRLRARALATAPTRGPPAVQPAAA